MPQLETERETATDQTAAFCLRSTMAATRIGFTWLGVRKTLSPAQKAQAADQFDAAAKFLSATKKLLDTEHTLFRAVTAVRGRILEHWKYLTLPYPDPELRLIRQQDVAEFGQTMHRFRVQLTSAV